MDVWPVRKTIDFQNECFQSWRIGRIQANEERKVCDIENKIVMLVVRRGMKFTVPPGRQKLIQV